MSLTLGTDSYLSLETAAAYFANRLHSQTWISASDPDRENALRMATTLVDSLDYHGTRATTSQLLAWPRRYVVDHDHRAVPTDQVPTAVQAATSEWAIHLLSHDPAQTQPVVTRRQVGDLEVEYSAALPDPLPTLVRLHLAPFLRTSQNTATIVP